MPLLTLIALIAFLAYPFWPVELKQPVLRRGVLLPAFVLIILAMREPGMEAGLAVTSGLVGLGLLSGLAWLVARPFRPVREAWPMLVLFMGAAMAARAASDSSGGPNPPPQPTVPAELPPERLLPPKAPEGGFPETRQTTGIPREQLGEQLNGQAGGQPGAPTFPSALNPNPEAERILDSLLQRPENLPPGRRQATAPVEEEFPRARCQDGVEDQGKILAGVCALHGGVADWVFLPSGAQGARTSQGSDAWVPAELPTTAAPTSRPEARSCCKYCSTGKACGNSCISRNKTCHQPPGCACNR